MRPRFLSTAVIGAVLAMPAVAQDSAGAPPPPEMEVLEEGEPPAATLRKHGSGEDTIIEKRFRGRVTGIRVERGESTYFLQPHEAVGSALPGDTQAPTIRAPQWRILEFDMQRPEERRQNAPGNPGATAPEPTVQQ